MKSVYATVGLALATAALAMPATAVAQARTAACEMASFKAPANATITQVRAFTAPVPYCRVDGYVMTNNPGPNDVKFMVALPQAWNGRYLFTVQGGSAGFVPDPTEPHLRTGYAIASTDKGSKVADGLDFEFLKNPGQAEDWGHRGTHVAAVATQALARAWYGKPKFYRYVMGCSGGGDGTLTEAEKHAEDFDGFLPGAMSYSPHWNQHWGLVAQRTNRDPSSWISPDELKRVGAAIMQKFDATDGAVDGLIWDPTKVVLARADFPFLNDAQFGTLKLIERGVTPVGGVSNPGFWMSNPSAMSRFHMGLTRPPWPNRQAQPAGFQVLDSGTRGTRGPSFNVLTDMDYSSARDMAEEDRVRRSDARAIFDPKNLARLKAQGAKMIMWTGSADDAVAPLNVVNYTRDVTKIYGPGRTSWYRSYFAPGMFHCRGGENHPTDFQDKLLEALIDWVEKGKAPDSVIASNVQKAASGAVQTPASRTYLLCSYPMRSVFRGGLANPGKLDVNDAKNWRCEA